MKAKHFKWEPMWDKYFSNYPGMEQLVECRQNKCQSEDSGQVQRDNIQDAERYNTSYSVSDPYSSLDRLYPVDKDSDIGFMVNEAEQSVINYKLPVSSAEPVIKTEGTEINVQKNIPTVRSSPLGKQPGNIIFECGTGQGFAFVTRDGQALTHAPYNPCIAKTLAITAIDTTCLKYPKTKVMFSCIIDFKSRAADSAAQLEFVLSRSCNNSTESPIGNWVYDIEKVNSCAQSFRFNFCSCNSFPGCYNYYVRVLPVYIKNCNVCITNCHIDAVAQSFIK